MSWFECKAKYQKMNEQGLQKTVTEVFLVNAESVGEAEEKTYKEVEPFIESNEDSLVTDVSRRKYSDVITSTMTEDDKFYKCKVMMVSLDEKSGTEKKKAAFIIVQAGDLKGALTSLIDLFKESVSDYEIHTIQETQILDVL